MRTSTRWGLMAVACVCMLSPMAAWSEDSSARVTFAKDVLPILQDHRDALDSDEAEREGGARRSAADSDAESLVHAHNRLDGCERQ